MFGSDIDEQSLQVLEFVLLTFQVLFGQENSFLKDDVNVFLALLESSVAINDV